MVSSKADTVAQYLRELPPERRAAIKAVRKVIRANLPRGFEEGMQYGMIGYYIPLSRYPDTYNGQPLGIAALASQKQYMSIYLMSIYGDPGLRSWFEKRFAEEGKKLNAGKSCVRFKTLDDLPLDVVGEAIAKVDVERYLALYESARKKTTKAKRAKKTRARKPR